MSQIMLREYGNDLQHTTTYDNRAHSLCDTEYFEAKYPFQRRLIAHHL